MNDMISALVEMNDKGLALLSAGDYEGAVTTFGAAIQVVKNEWESLALLSSSSSSLGENETLLSIPVLGEEHDDVMMTMHHSSDASFQVFTQGLTLSVPMMAVNDRSSALRNAPMVGDPHVLVAMMLYNGALTRHVQALVHTTSNSTKMLRKAAHMYGLALQLLRKSMDMIMTTTTTDTCSLLLLALCNNMAAIALHTFDRPLFDTHHRILAHVLSESTVVVPELFASNYVAAVDSFQRPAPAA